MPSPGPLNALTDVAGLAVGNAEDRQLLTGATAVVADAPARAAIDVAGGAPGTRNTDALGHGRLIDRLDAVVLSGGSAYGLDAAGGAMDWLRDRGRGFEIAGTRVPLVASAIIFDLALGAPKDWDAPPWWELGRAAAAAAGRGFSTGNAGAGIGATAGALKGGLGTASAVAEGVTVGAIAVVNPLGSVVMPGTRTFWAWDMEEGDEFGGLPPPAARPSAMAVPKGAPGANTTIAVVATDAALDGPALARVARMAQDGLAMAIRPSHTPLDGDTVFALSTARVAGPEDPRGLAALGMLAGRVLARAVARGVHAAEPLAGVPAWRDLPE